MLLNGCKFFLLVLVLHVLSRLIGLTLSPVGVMRFSSAYINITFCGESSELTVN